MKNIWKFILSISVSMAILFGVLLSVGLVLKKQDEQIINNNDNVVTETNPDTYGDMIYYASEGETTGAEEAPKANKGGAIYVGNGSTFTMSGGTISNFESQFGGAIYVASGGTFEMTGGTIEYNYSEYGGAIYVEDGGKCFIKGGDILNNKSENAPAIYVADGGKLEISSSVNIDKNYEISYGNVVINFFVDGVMTQSAVQYAPTLNFNYMPLTYNECCGYFFDEDMTIGVERGEDLAGLRNDLQAQSVSASHDGTVMEFFNLYTKTPTFDMINISSSERKVSAKSTSAVKDEVVVPRSIGGVEITTVGSFSNCYNLKNIILPQSITTIESDAFRGNTNLVSFRVPKNVTVINAKTFQNCSKLSEFVFNDKVTTIGSNAFERCSELKSIEFPNSLKTINAWALALTGLENVVLPDSVTFLGGSSFYDSKLKEIKLSSKTSQIYASTFRYCRNLKIVNIPDSIDEIYTTAFSDCSALESINLPDSIQKIGDRAFQNCTLLTTIKFPVNLINLGAETFKNCTKLASVDLSCVTPLSGNDLSLGTSLFEGCTSLVSASFGPTCRSLSNSMFKNCTSLTSVFCPDFVTSIGTYAFAGCSALETMLLPSISTISEGMFSDCTNLKSIEYIYNPASIIDVNAFKNCTALTTFDFIDVSTIGDSAFYNSGLEYIYLRSSITSMGGCIFESCKNLKSIDYDIPQISIDPTTFVSVGTNTTGVLVTFGENVIAIPMGIFDCSINIMRVKFNTSEKFNSIGGYAFNNAKINEIELPTVGNYSIGYMAFANTNLRNVTIPMSVSLIESYAFDNCSYLEEVNIYSDFDGAFGNPVLQIDEYAFRNPNDNVLIIKLHNIIGPTPPTMPPDTVWSNQIYGGTIKAFYDVNVPSAPSLEDYPMHGEGDYYHYYTVMNNNIVIKHYECTILGCNLENHNYTEIVTNAVVATPENAQEVLDGDINGKIVIFTAGNYNESLEIRPTKETATVYEYDWENPNNLVNKVNNWNLANTGLYHYYRKLENVQFIGLQGAIFNRIFAIRSQLFYSTTSRNVALGIADSDTVIDPIRNIVCGNSQETGGYYAHIDVNNVTFDNMDFRGLEYTDEDFINSKKAVYGRIHIESTLNTAMINNVTVKNCTFDSGIDMEIYSSALYNYPAVRIYHNYEASNVKFENNTVDSYFQGLYVQNINSASFIGNKIYNTTHNAIAIQSNASGTYATNDFIIRDNTLENIGSRGIRFGVCKNADITVEDNSFTNCLGGDQLLAAQSVSINIKYNFNSNIYKYVDEQGETQILYLDDIKGQSDEGWIVVVTVPTTVTEEETV